MTDATATTETPITWDEIIRRGFVGAGGVRAGKVKFYLRNRVIQTSTLPDASHRSMDAREMILEWIRSQAVPKTRAEIAAALGYESPAGGFARHMQALEESGEIYRGGNVYTDDPTKFSALPMGKPESISNRKPHKT